MKTVLFVAALSLLTFGCKKKKAADATNDCTAAVSRSMALSKTEMEKMGTTAADMEKMTGLGVRRCTEDKWSADTIKCMVDAKTMADSQACYGKLTPEQQDKMNQAAADELGKGPHDTGSAGSGSAGSGSAGKDATGSGSGSDATGSGSGSDATGSGSAGSAAPPA